MARPCNTPGCPRLAHGGPRCKEHERQHNTTRNRQRTHYHGNYRQRAAQVRATATHCWICNEGPRPNDPWQADHLVPGDPNSPLRAAHRSCNASRGNTPLHDTHTAGDTPNT